MPIVRKLVGTSPIRYSEEFILLEMNSFETSMPHLRLLLWASFKKEHAETDISEASSHLSHHSNAWNSVYLTRRYQSREGCLMPKDILCSDP